MEVIGLFVFGAIAGYLAGVALFEDGGVGIAGHVVVGSLAGIVGGYMASMLLGLADPANTLSPMALVAGVVSAIVTVVLVNAYAERVELRA